MRVPSELYTRNSLENKEMRNANLRNKIIIPISFLVLSLMLSSSFINSNHIFAAGKFSVDAKIDLKSLSHPEKLKVVASANGETGIKYLTGNDLNSNIATVSFEFNEKNDIVSVGSRDEYFVCAYAIDPITNQMQSYSCVEGNIENSDGKNKISIGSGAKKTLSTGIFQTVSGSEINSPTINVWIPLSDRKDTKQLKVVTMIKGEFESRIINVQELLKKSNDNTINLPIVYDKVPEIGDIKEGDMFYACVSANELNPPEGTECEHRVTSHTFHVHNIVAR
jgi:hypothetical protein